MRAPLSLVITLLVFACSEEEKSLVPGVPLEVAKISLQPTLWSNSRTVIANGVNAVQFEIQFLNVRGVPVLVEDHPMEVWVNGKTELPFPYRFTTAKAGTFQFSLRTNDGRIFSENAFTVKAIVPTPLESYRLPVVFHYFHPGRVPLTSEEKSALVKFYTDSLSVVNDAFANRRGSLDPNALAADVEFYLANEDPDGSVLEFPGFEFVDAPGLTSDWQNIERHVIDGHYWPTTRYINVWIVDLEGVSAVAFYPEYDSTGSSYPTSWYGTFMDRQGKSPGILLAHEFGHMLDLKHVFGADCVLTDDCEDTHGYVRTSVNWTTAHMIRTDCEYQLFAATNYMDYFSDNTTFTSDQVTRMYKALRFSPFLPTAKNISSGRRSQVPSSVVTNPLQGRIID